MRPRGGIARVNRAQSQAPANGGAPAPPDPLGGILGGSV